MNTTVLEKIGLTTGEAKVYLALLKKGQCSAGPITTEARISRSKVYEILERLIAKGLCSFITQNGVKLFKAIDPRLIQEYLTEKKTELEQQTKDFLANLPALLAQTNAQEPSHSVQVFTGWPAIKNVFNLLIKDAKKGDVCYAFGIPEALSVQRSRFFRHWRAQTDAIGITQQLIVHKKISKSPEFDPTSAYSKIRYTAQETPTSVDIFKNTTILGVWVEQPFVIQITSKSVADSFKNYFDQLWKTSLKKPY